MNWNSFGSGTRTFGARTIYPLNEELQNVIMSKDIGPITNPAQCIEELILNSIDANSESILVTIDPENNKIKVEDDGIGINRQDFEVIGTRFFTSKCQEIGDLRHMRFYGYRGESLHEVLSTSPGVEFYTKPQDINSSSPQIEPLYRKFKYGNPIGSIHAVAESKRLTNGLTIVVHGLLQGKESNQEFISTLGSIIKRIYLMNPRVSFQLFNAQISNTVLSTFPAPSSLEAFKRLYLNNLGKSVSLLEVFHMFDVYFCSGWFSTETHTSERLQMVYFNKRLLSRDSVYTFLDEKIQDIISQRTPQTILAKNTGQYSIFMVNISCDLDEVTLTRGVKDMNIKFNDLNKVRKAVGGLVQTFKDELEKEQKNIKTGNKYLVSDGYPSKESKDSREIRASNYQAKRAVDSRSALRVDQSRSPKFDPDVPDTPPSGNQNFSIISSQNHEPPLPHHNLSSSNKKEKSNFKPIISKPLGKVNSLKQKKDAINGPVKQIERRKTKRILPKMDCKNENMLLEEKYKGSTSFEGKHEVNFDSDIEDSPSPPERNSSQHLNTNYYSSVPSEMSDYNNRLHNQPKWQPLQRTKAKVRRGRNNHLF